METNSSDLALAPQRSQHLTFFLGDAEYAIAILRVREIIEYSVATRVPGTPAFIHGVINLRGSVVPVIDLAIKLGITPSPITKRTCAVVVEAELHEAGDQQVVMALLADSVSQVVDFKPDDIMQPPAFGTNVDVGYLAGLGKLEDRFVLMLDIDRVLSAGELVDLSAMHTLAREPAPDPEPIACTPIADTPIACTPIADTPIADTPIANAEDHDPEPQP